MEIHTVKDLSKLIKQKRMALKMTQADASALCNVGIRFLSELENYENILSYDIKKCNKKTHIVSII